MSQHGEKPTVLIICDYYLPGFESGGAMRTLVNMVDRLGSEFDFKIVTRDHDGPLDRKPYAGVAINDWNRVGEADVYYLSRDRVGPVAIATLIKDVGPDALYLNSFFSPLTVFVLALQKLKRIRQIPIILAPEGEFSPGALSLKRVKKQLYITTAKLLRLLHDVVWKAASESERADIETVVGRAETLIAPNMPPTMILKDYDPRRKAEKNVGAARMVFLSRYMRKKNFNWLLEHLAGVRGDLSIDICGPLEEADYWDEARRMIEALPDNVNVSAKGPVPHEQVAETLAKYQFFVLPTLGENFGHVFIEALAAGCPLIISDRTPWRDLEEKGIGWDLSLDEPGPWVDVINGCLDMSGSEYQEMSQNARDFAHSWLSDPEIEGSNRKVLQFALAKRNGK